MSSSLFHQHFRTVTSLSLLRFQKQLRLIEVRQPMLWEGATARSAAFNVGHESVPQFTGGWEQGAGISLKRKNQPRADHPLQDFHCCSQS